MSLKSSKNTETNVWELEIAISAEDFEVAIQKAYNKQKSKISIPGFRKGKVSRQMIEGRYGKGFFYEDALDACYGPALEAAIEEAKLEVVGTKKVDVKSIGAEGVELTVELFVKPEVELTAYKELEATVKPVEATEAEVDAKLEALREKEARIITVDDRAAQDGDIAVIDFEGFMDGVAFEGGKGEDTELTLGAGQFIPGFEEQIIGHNTGDEFDINVTFPEDYHEELAGKPAVFKIKLHEIKVKELPEIDDELAQDQACDTLEELKKNLEKEIIESKEHQNDHDAEQQLLDKLADNVNAEIPDCMVETELDSQVKDIEYRLSMQGLNFDTYLGYMGMSREDYRDRNRDNALKQVKLHLAIEKIIALEEISATEEELEEKYKEYADQYKMEVEKLKELVNVEGLKQDIAATKALKLVKDTAKLTVAEEKAESEDAE